MSDTESHVSYEADRERGRGPRDATYVPLDNHDAELPRDGSPGALEAPEVEPAPEPEPVDEPAPEPEPVVEPAPEPEPVVEPTPDESESL